MHISPFPAIFPNLAFVSSNEGFFNQVKERYREYHENGFFHPPGPEAFYAYQIEFQGERYNGLVATVAIKDYLEDRIKRHEKTLGPKEQMQLDLLMQRRAAVKPVLLAHTHFQPLADKLSARTRKDDAIQEIQFENGERHRFWPIQESESIYSIQHYFREHIQQAYIADGHHRFSSAARLYQQLGAESHRSLLCALFPTTALRIHNFNRVVDAFQSITPLSFMARLSQYGQLNPIRSNLNPRQSHELTFFVEREWFRLNWHPPVLARHAEVGLPVMDVSLLNHCVLQDLLGIKDVRNDERIKYLEGPRGLPALERAAQKRDSIAFCLHPLSWQAFFRVVNHGYVLPPKSTWFEPRMRNGLIVQAFE